MSTDIDALVAPISEAEPAGPDLSYDPARQSIESAFDISISDDLGASTDTDWRELLRAITAQAEQTRDIWLAVYWMRAGAKAGQLEAIEDGARLLAKLFEQQWATVHPQLDDYGFQGRKGPCESLTRIGEFLNPLRDVVLLEHPRLGRYSGADFARFRDGGASEDGYGMFRALLEETSHDDLKVIVGKMNGIADAIRRADAILVVHADGDTGTNFQPTYAALQHIARSVGFFVRSQVADTVPADGGFHDADNDHHDGGGEVISGRVNSRPDVLRALNAIDDYYKRKEPASPVPFALRRAREWVSLDFLSVLEDIAPGSLEEARKVLMSSRNGSEFDDST